MYKTVVFTHFSMFIHYVCIVSLVLYITLHITHMRCACYRKYIKICFCLGSLSVDVLPIPADLQHVSVIVDAHKRGFVIL